MVYLHEEDERERRDMSFKNRFLVPRLLGKLISWLLLQLRLQRRGDQDMRTAKPLIEQGLQNLVRRTILGRKYEAALTAQAHQDLEQSSTYTLLSSLLVL